MGPPFQEASVTVGEEVGERTKEARRISVPALCSWCGLVRVGNAWVEDRRVAYVGRYTEGVCPNCQTDYFRDSLSRVGTRKKY